MPSLTQQSRLEENFMIRTVRNLLLVDAGWYLLLRKETNKIEQAMRKEEYHHHHHQYHHTGRCWHDMKRSMKFTNDRQRREIVVSWNLLSATNYNRVRSSRSCTLFSLSRGRLLAQDRHEQNAGESSSTSLHERGTAALWFSSSRRSSSDRRRTRMKLDKGRQKQAERECCVCARQSTKQEKHKKTKFQKRKTKESSKYLEHPADGALASFGIQAQGSVSRGVFHFRHAVRLLAH